MWAWVPHTPACGPVRQRHRVRRPHTIQQRTGRDDRTRSQDATTKRTRDRMTRRIRWRSRPRGGNCNRSQSHDCFQRKNQRVAPPGARRYAARSMPLRGSPAPQLKLAHQLSKYWEYIGRWIASLSIGRMYGIFLESLSTGRFQNVKGLPSVKKMRGPSRTPQRAMCLLRV